MSSSLSGWFGTSASKASIALALTLGLASTSACSGWRLKGSKSAVDEGAADEKKTTIPWPKEREGMVPQATNEPGAVFLLDGEPMCFHGSNNYYFIFKSEEMIDSVLQNSKDIGLSVFRHWAHLDAGSLDGKVPHLKDDGTKEGVYFQYWDTKANAPAYNEGKNGLERLDIMMAKARQYGIRMVLTLTNNWPDFGGMDQYLIWYGLDKHPQFYTDERVKKAYKDWVAYLLNRTNSITGVPYKDDPYIFAWELANEPRTRNYSKFDATKEYWDENTITNWAREMAEHVRSIDPNHLIAMGDEGFFWRDGESNGFYAGADGVDHDALLAIDDIDYGTYHLYPDHWGTGTIWGDKWISDHLAAARVAGKPTVLEEYGIVVTRDDQTKKILEGWDRRERTYKRWNDIILLGGGAGSMYWMQAGYDDYLKRDYTDFDHFTVYSTATDPTAKLIQSYAQRFQQDARVCQLAREGQPIAKRQVPQGFVTVSQAPAQWPQAATPAAEGSGQEPPALATAPPALAPAPAAMEASPDANAAGGTPPPATPSHPPSPEPLPAAPSPAVRPETSPTTLQPPPSPAPVEAAPPETPAPAQPKSSFDVSLEQLEDWTRAEGVPSEGRAQ